MAYRLNFTSVSAICLTKLCNDLLSGGRLPPSWAESRIIVIPKKDRDPLNMESYRPISLLNVDEKFFASVMAKRLNCFIEHYVHLDQSGFIPTRKLSDNIRKMLNVIHYSTTHKIPTLIVAFDADKAFNRLEPVYLFTLIKAMNFGPSFMRAVGALYANPMAQVCVNGFRSEDFRLGRGTRQGCPLSPILFAVSLEPLAAAIRNNSEILGVEIDSNSFKLNLFADDTVVYLRDPLYSLPVLVSEFEAFGNISGFMINQSKSEVYPVALTASTKNLLM